MPAPPPRGSARFDETGRYRYRLTRVWDSSRPPLVWIMLNPSTATDIEDDQTIRRVVGFSQSWGHGSAVVVNLFALMATRPEQLAASPEPVGSGNDAAIGAAVAEAPTVILAWGNHGSLPNPTTGVARADEVGAMLAGGGPRLVCLGRTRSGQPFHPLYKRRDANPTPF